MVMYDKLKNIKTDENVFDFKCPECKANGHDKGVFDIRPLGISWKSDYMNNMDIKNIAVRDGLNKLPTLRTAINTVIAQNNNYANLIIECLKCKRVVSTYDKIQQSDIKKWLSKNLPEYLDLNPERMKAYARKARDSNR